jgi:short-subunit dehydrogenase
MSYVAVITGASSGIGEAAARGLPGRIPGADIIIVARRRDRLDALAAELNAELAAANPDGQAHFHPYAADLTDPNAVAGLTAYVRDTFGHVDLLVNNAGARWSQSFADGGYANVHQTMEINFDAQVRLTEMMLPLLRAAVGGAELTVGNTATKPAIVNVASTAGRVARSGTTAYSASKFALIGWNDALHMELKAEGIHVGLINPGFIVTEGFPQAELASHPLKRHLLGTVDQVADAIFTAGIDGKAEIYVPGFYWAFAVMRIVAPGLIRKAAGGGAFTPKTAQDDKA